MPNSILFKITKDSNCSYLFGTFHIGSPELDKISIEVKLAYEKASQIIVESLLSDISLLQRNVNLQNRAWYNKEIKNLEHDERIKIEKSLRKYIKEIIAVYFPEAWAPLCLEAEFLAQPPIQLIFMINNIVLQDATARYKNPVKLDISLIELGQKANTPVFQLENDIDTLSKMHGLKFNYQEQMEFF